MMKKNYIEWRIHRELRIDWWWNWMRELVTPRQTEHKTDEWES